jgi:hypothetical protein
MQGPKINKNSKNSTQNNHYSQVVVFFLPSSVYETQKSAPEGGFIHLMLVELPATAAGSKR